MNLGGRAFTKPLPIALGSNIGGTDYGIDTPGLVAAQGMGMKWNRDEVPWNFVKSGGITGFEVVAGTYLQSTATAAAASVAATKSYGMKPLMVVSVNNTPGLSATWTSGIPCTPAQFALAMAWLVAQPGLQGLDWELFNEPDGTAWGITPTLLTAAYAAAYPAMKAADPTCTVWSMVLEAMAPAGFGGGTDYYNLLIAAGFLTAGPGGTPPADGETFHIYFPNTGFTTGDTPPMSYSGAYGAPGWLSIANFQKNRLSKGDTLPMGITEFGWQNTGDGTMTPQRQAQFNQDFLVSLSGNDPVNSVAFSSYLRMLINYAMESGGANWAIIGEPAVAVLTELVSGH